MLTCPRLLTASLFILGLAISSTNTAIAQDSAASLIESSVAADTLPKGKQTQAGLYLSAADAVEVLSAHEDVLLIDVRTPEETVLVGYATDTDANIPLAQFDPAHRFNAKSGSYAMIPNRDFAKTAAAFLNGRDPAAVLVICRSGGRSARAVDLMLKAGVDLPLYSVVDGFEGDRSKAGRRDVNGWKNAQGEWTYKPRADLLVSGQ